MCKKELRSELRSERSFYLILNQIRKLFTGKGDDRYKSLRTVDETYEDPGRKRRTGDSKAARSVSATIELPVRQS
jgi:hypothetical protein